MTFKEVWEKTDAVRGLFKREDGVPLYNAARRVPRYGLVVELGALFGKSTTLLAEVGRERGYAVVTIDCMAFSSKQAGHLRDNMEKYNNVHIIEATSHATAGWWNKPIDLLFIDANHQEDGIKEDCEDWLPHIKKGGMVAFHDYYQSQFASVKKQADLHTGSWPAVAKGGKVLVRKKVH